MNTHNQEINSVENQHEEPCPETHMGLAILFMFICMPVGIVGIMQARRIKKLWKDGKKEEAKNLAKSNTLPFFIGGTLLIVIMSILFAWVEDMCSKESYTNPEEQVVLIDPPEGELLKDWVKAEAEELLTLFNCNWFFREASDKGLSDKEIEELFGNIRLDPNKLKEFLLKRSSKARKLRGRELPGYYNNSLGDINFFNTSPGNLNMYVLVAIMPIGCHAFNTMRTVVTNLNNYNNYNYFVLKLKEELKIVKEYRRIFEEFDMLNRDDEAVFDYFEKLLEEPLEELIRAIPMLRKNRLIL